MPQLYPFQEQGVEFLLKHHYALLGDAMGLGKTFQALEVVKQTQLKTLVVCPAYLKLNWSAEIRKFYSPLNKLITIVSYAKLGLIREKFELVVADECHYLKNPLAKRTNHFHDIVLKSKPERLILLSGTPIKNRVTEFYTLLSMCSLNPKKTSGENLNERFKNYYAFCDFFANRTQKMIAGRRITSYEGHRNIDVLLKYMKDKYLRRKAEDVLDLPPIIYKDVETDSLMEDLTYVSSFNEYATTNKMSTHISTAKAKAALDKVAFTVQYCKDLMDQSCGPLVIFTDHVYSCHQLSISLSKEYRVESINGATPVQIRHTFVERFQHGSIDILVLTIGAGSTGFTLTKANHLIFNDLPWVPGDYLQAMKRIHRIGQKNNCVVHHIVGGQVDKMISKTLKKKIDTLDKVL